MSGVAMTDPVSSISKPALDTFRTLKAVQKYITQGSPLILRVENYHADNIKLDEYHVDWEKSQFVRVPSLTTLKGYATEFVFSVNSFAKSHSLFRFRLDVHGKRKELLIKYDWTSEYKGKLSMQIDNQNNKTCALLTSMQVNDIDSDFVARAFSTGSMIFLRIDDVDKLNTSV